MRGAAAVVTLMAALCAVPAAGYANPHPHAHKHKHARRVWPRPVSLLGDAPVAPVRLAAAAARADAPLPSPLGPTAGAVPPPDLPANCLPSFGSGTTYDLCSLGAVDSRHTVVLLGDSHASMWGPALLTAATRLDFRLVPLAKPGCALWALFEDRPGWPCLTWWRGVLRALRRLRPSATIVSFLTGNFPVAQAPFAARVLERVLRAVPHPVLLADPPSDDWYTLTVPPPSQCMSAPGANQGSCALREVPQMRASLSAIQAMVNRDRVPAIPTIQWFCATGICPTVIDGTVTSEDGNHITAAYAQLLAPRLVVRLRPVLHHLWRRRPRRSG